MFFSTALIVPLALSIFLAINMGGSGTAPSFAAAYGSGTIRRNLIPILFGVAVIAGALLAGEQVSTTLGKGLLPQHFFTLTVTSVILFSVGISLLLANLLGIPQSTTQSSVFAIIAAAHYLDRVNTHKLFVEIIPLWFILPIVAFFLMWTITKWVFPYMRKSVVSTQLQHLQGHPIIKFFLIGSSLYVAFAIGTNNVAHAAGPIASMVVRESELANSATDFSTALLYAMLIIAPCFGLGSLLLGYKVTKNVGKSIVEVTPVSATFIASITASLLLFSSIFKGIPSSLVQLNIGAFMGYSAAKVGTKLTFENNSLRQLFIMWAIAPLIAYGLVILMLYCLDEWALL